MASQVLSLVNKERAKAGIPSLKAYAPGDKAAMKRAKRSAKNSIISDQMEVSILRYFLNTKFMHGHLVRILLPAVPAPLPLREL